MIELIPKGQAGWKVRRLEILILEVMGRATQPNTGWDVYQKIKRKVSTHGNEVCIRMKNLAGNDYLITKGFDNDGDSLYEINPNSGTSRG